MVRIRLRRVGRKKQASYRIVAADARCPRDGRFIEEIGYYDTDTITEDIDLTMKLLNHFGNTKYHFGYAEDVIAYTPPVHYFNQLLKQRYRWKYGRFKALFKYRQMIFSKDTKKYTDYRLGSLIFQL